MRGQILIKRIGSAALLMCAATSSQAEPLPAETCATIKSEQDTLTAAGVATDLAKGPAWAKANLPRERLAQISRYISLEEQMLFRCGLAKLKSTLAPEIEEAGALTSEPAPAAPKGKPKPKSKASPQPAPPGEAPAAKADVGRPLPAKAAQPTPSTEPSAKPKIIKPKVDDAYRPSTVNPAADPFAKQVAPAKQ